MTTSLVSELAAELEELAAAERKVNEVKERVLRSIERELCAVSSAADPMVVGMVARWLKVRYSIPASAVEPYGHTNRWTGVRRYGVNVWGNPDATLQAWIMLRRCGFAAKYRPSMFASGGVTIKLRKIRGDGSFAE